MRKIIPLCFLLCLLVINSARTSSLPRLKAENPDLIARYQGQKVEVTGTILDTHIAKSGKVRFLNFGPDWKKAFTVVIFTTDLLNFKTIGEPTRYYLGKKVLVSGKVKIYRQRPEIIAKNPSQIKLLK